MKPVQRKGATSSRAFALAVCLDKLAPTVTAVVHTTLSWSLHLLLQSPTQHNTLLQFHAHAIFPLFASAAVSISYHSSTPSAQVSGLAEASHYSKPTAHQTSPHAATMPLAERDMNLPHQLPLTRGKRLPAAGSVTNENSAHSPSIPRAKATPTQSQRFLPPTKASVAKNTPSRSVDRTRGQPHSGRSTPLSQPHNSRLPRRNTATPTPKPAFSPPISRRDASASTGHFVYADSSADSQRSSPSPSPYSRTVNDQASVCRAYVVANLGPTHMFSRSPLTLCHAARTVPVSRSHCRHVRLLHSPMCQALHGTDAA